MLVKYAQVDLVGPPFAVASAFASHGFVHGSGEGALCLGIHVVGVFAVRVLIFHKIGMMGLIFPSAKVGLSGQFWV
jgi:hypothetical protein